MRRNAARQAPAPPASAPSPRGRGASATPPCAAHSARARSSSWSTGWSVDSKPRTSTARSPVAGAGGTAPRAGSSSRRLAGSRPLWTTARTPSAPSAKPGKRTVRAARCDGRGCTRTHASVMTPSVPSLPSSSRSGDGPAPLPGQAPRRPRPARGDRAHRLDDVVDVGQARGEVPARARGHPPAERRELERLRVEAQREPVLGELRLEPRAAGPRPDPRRPRDRVDLVQRVECPEVERHGPGEARGDARLDTADDARPAAVGHDRRAGGLAQARTSSTSPSSAGRATRSGACSKVAAQRRGRRPGRTGRARGRRARRGRPTTARRDRPAPPGVARAA